MTNPLVSKPGDVRFPDYPSPPMESVPFYWVDNSVMYWDMKLTNWIATIHDMMAGKPDPEKKLFFSSEGFEDGSYHSCVVMIH